MIYLIRFYDLLDVYVKRVFAGVGDEFAKNSDGEYICGKDIFGSNSFKRGFEKYILSEVIKSSESNIFNSDYYFILGDCRPNENVLLNLRDTGYTVVKTKYGLVESDIKIDVKSFNRSVDFVFNRLFRRKADMPGNVFAISHAMLGSQTLMMFLKTLFGKVNCCDVNMQQDSRRCLYSSNDSIEAAITGKARLNALPITKNIMTAISQYVSECMKMDWSV